MANNMTDFLANELIDHVLRDADYTPPALIALALFSTATDDSSGGTEIDDTFDYARLAVEHATGRTFSAASGGSTDNDQEWAFVAANGGDWDQAVGMKIADASTHSLSTAGGGNYLFHGALTTPKTAEDGDVIRFPAGSLVVSLT